MRHNNKMTGFTLVEVLVVAPIVILVIGAFVAGLMYLTGDALLESRKVKLINDTQTVLDRIEDDVKMSGAFLAVNNMTLTTPQGYNDATANFTNVGLSTGPALILNSFVTNSNPQSPSRTLVYIADLPNSCASGSALYQNQIMTMNIVYFIKDNTLWKRTLASANYASKDCAGTTIWQRPSCSPGLSGGVCISQDEALLKVNGTVSLAIDYFDSASSATPLTGATAGTDTARQATLDTAKSIQITVTANATAAGRDVSQQSSLRISRVGSLIKYATPL
jgi:type II secretory pathway pseudopilin PulG